MYTEIPRLKNYTWNAIEQKIPLLLLFPPIARRTSMMRYAIAPQLIFMIIISLRGTVIVEKSGHNLPQCSDLK